MLYVFHVDTGRMIKFDMNVALTSVQNLKDIIEKRHGLPADKVVLLVSGGEMLTPNSLVCSYSAGTDTNPIYMFTTIDIKPQPWPSIEPGHFSDNDLTEQVERCLSLPSAHSTIVASAQLGQQFYDLALEEETICETLVHEQHLQQQGWSAVIANMEDLTEEFRQRFETFGRSFEEHLSKRSDHLELLHNFNYDLMNLSKIPILPGLLQNAEEEFHGFDVFLDNDDVFSRSMIVQSSTNNSNNNNSDTNINETNQGNSGISGSGDGSGTNIRTMITSSSGSSSVVEQKRPRLSKENTPDTIVVKNSGSKSDTSNTNNKAVMSSRNLTLLQWISAKENNAALRVMAEECSQGLSTFSAEKYEQLKNEVFNIIKYAEQEEIKEIKGLEDRLSGLEKLMFNLKKIVQDQGGHSTALQQSQNRTSRLGDPSILPDLCESHRGQLRVMLTNHKQIRDFRRRISKAKDELGLNLNKRLKFIVQIENAMSERDHSLLFYHRCQRRVERHINIIQQIHQTPNIYLAAVTEVVRRRIFSGEFVQWASNLACDFDAIHSEEVERRRQFNSNFEGHFLNILFPGMNDMPPAFANENPIIFDSCLPNITKNDIDMLSNFLPDISDNIQLPDMRNVIDFFISRSGNKNSDEKMSTTQNELISENAERTVLSHRPIDIHAHLKDGFESETDTEEFEKVGDKSATESQPVENEKILTKLENIRNKISMSTSTSENKPNMQSIYIETEPIQTNTVETLTEDNIVSREEEIEKFKSLLRCMSQVSNQCVQLLKENVQSLRSDQEKASTEVHERLQNLSKTWNLVQKQYESNELKKDELRRVHELEIKNLRESINQYEIELEQLKSKQISIESSHLEEVQRIKTESNQLRQTLAVRSEEIEQLQDKLKAADEERIKALNDLKEKLVHEHKNELESLRCRFKIMTSMERSPSDTSLEKIEKSDMIDISCHESILLQTREDLNIEKELAVLKARKEFNIEKEKAIQEAIAMERLKWEESNIAMNTNMELLKKSIEEKDKLLDMMRERKLIINQEINQLQKKIEATTNEEMSERILLKKHLEVLNINNQRLQQKLNFERNKTKRLEMDSSVSTTKSDQSLIVSTDTCSSGDLVFVVWNVRHGQFIVVQESPNLFFVHAESLVALNLKLPLVGDIEVPIPFFTIAKVVQKEYCKARTDENRYKVSKGTKFFRVKLQPMTEMKWLLRRERLETESVSSATSVNRSQHFIDSFSVPTSSTCDNPELNFGITQTNSEAVSNVKASASQDLVDSVSLKEHTISVSSLPDECEGALSLLTGYSQYSGISENYDQTVTDQPSSLSTGMEDTGIFLTATFSTSGSLWSTKSSSSDVETTTISTSDAISSGISTSISTISNIQIGNEKEQTDDSDEYRSLETKEDFIEFSTQETTPSNMSINEELQLQSSYSTSTPSTITTNEDI